jgi:hypothetical protein
MKKILLATTILAMMATASTSGGPVIEDTTEAEPLVRSHNNKLVPILFGLAVAAIILGRGSSDLCTVEETTPEPTPEPC